MMDFMVHMLRDPGSLVVWGGYPALALVIFLETGALAFFLPGDSLLVLAGFYAANGDLNIFTLNSLLIGMAIAGDACSYFFGYRLGQRILNRWQGKWISSKHIDQTKNFYAKHGGKAIVLARFVPIVRTFMPVVAGVGNMGYGKFATYNVVGALLWVMSMTLTGYFLGIRFPFLLQHIEKVVLLIIVLSLLPGLVEFLRHRWIKSASLK